MLKSLRPYVMTLAWLFAVIIWVIHLYSILTQTDLRFFGVHPRHWDEWYTMFTGALIHSGFDHLVNNTYALVVLGVFIKFLFEKKSYLVYISTYILSGLLIFLFARSSTYHIGISGVVYSWAAFLAVSGIIRKDRLSLGIALAVAFLYGSMIWGVFPIKEGVSWDGHLYGAVAGVIMAVVFKDVNKAEQEELVLEEGDLPINQEFGYLRNRKES